MRTFGEVDGMQRYLTATASLLHGYDRADNSNVLNLMRCQLSTIKYFGYSILFINFVVILSQERSFVSWFANNIIIQRYLQALWSVFAILQII